VKARVTDKDHGYKAAIAQLSKLAKFAAPLTVGVHASEGASAEKDGATILEVAIWNEFGTNTIPARSFLRAWFDENHDLIIANLKKAMASVMRAEMSRSRRSPVSASGRSGRFSSASRVASSRRTRRAPSRRRAAERPHPSSTQARSVRASRSK
jgi:hypothetical protein